MFRFLVVYVGDATVAEELAQEALERVCRHWRSVRQMDAPGAWLHRVALNLTSSYFRRKRAERRARVRCLEDGVYELPDVASHLVLAEAAAELPTRWRQAVLLRHVAGLSVEETSEVMAATDSAVRTLTSRGLARLRALMSDELERQDA